MSGRARSALPSLHQLGIPRQPGLDGQGRESRRIRTGPLPLSLELLLAAIVHRRQERHRLLLESGGRTDAPRLRKVQPGASGRPLLAPPSLRTLGKSAPPTTSASRWAPTAHQSRRAASWVARGPPAVFRVPGFPGSPPFEILRADRGQARSAGRLGRRAHPKVVGQRLRQGALLLRRWRRSGPRILLRLLLRLARDVQGLATCAQLRRLAVQSFRQCATRSAAHPTA
mmetsp:Transcript_4385/g.11454  ORF Transcript_4385/g.11454 Transcript_4385/m.11454 type:complete len:228 (-) Transcript_4385:232-915(-)